MAIICIDDDDRYDVMMKATSIFFESITIALHQLKWRRIISIKQMLYN